MPVEEQEFPLKVEENDLVVNVSKAVTKEKTTRTFVHHFAH